MSYNDIQILLCFVMVNKIVFALVWKIVCALVNKIVFAMVDLFVLLLSSSFSPFCLNNR